MVNNMAISYDIIQVENDTYFKVNQKLICLGGCIV